MEHTFFCFDRISIGQIVFIFWIQVQFAGKFER